MPAVTLLVFYFLLAMSNPRASLTLTPGGLALGTTAKLEWTLSGSTDRISRLEIWLEGREAATYRVGTNTRTDHNTFERIAILDTESHADMRMGEAEVPVPEFSVHSFDAPNNKIQWYLKVKGDIKKWPDVSNEFAVSVLPAGENGKER